MTHYLYDKTPLNKCVIVKGQKYPKVNSKHGLVSLANNFKPFLALTLCWFRKHGVQNRFLLTKNKSDDSLFLKP